MQLYYIEQNPFQLLSAYLMLPFSIYVFAVLSEKTLNWDNNKVYDRVLTLCTSILATLIFICINKVILISSFLISIIIVLIVMIVLAFKTSNKNAAFKKIFIITAYSFLITIFFTVWFPSNSSNETIHRLEKISYEFKSQDSYKLEQLVSKNIDEIINQNKIQKEEDDFKYLIALIIAASLILLIETKNKEDFPTS